MKEKIDNDYRKALMELGADDEGVVEENGGITDEVDAEEGKKRKRMSKKQPFLINFMLTHYTCIAKVILSPSFYGTSDL